MKTKQIDALLDAHGFKACGHPDCDPKQPGCATDHMRSKARALVKAVLKADALPPAPPSSDSLVRAARLPEAFPACHHWWTADTHRAGVRRCYKCGASEPAQGSCLICGQDRLFAVYHESALVGVCAECRNRALPPAPECSPAKPEKHTDTCAGHDGLRYCDCGVDQRKYPDAYTRGGPEPDYIKLEADASPKEPRESCPVCDGVGTVRVIAEADASHGKTPAEGDA